MAHVFRDAVREVVTANGGVVSFPLAGIRGGATFRTFAEASIADGDTLDYVAEGGGAREWGIATYGAGLLARSASGSVAGGVPSAGGHAFPAGMAVTIGIVLTAARATALTVLDPTLAALVALGATPGLLAQTGAAAFAKRTFAGTAGEIAVANGDGASGAPVVSLPASLTLTGKNVTGGSFAAMQALGIRSSGVGAFDLSLVNTETLTAGRTLTLKLNDAPRTIDLAGNLTLAGALATAGANALTLTTTGPSNVTLPTSGTLMQLAGGQNLTGGFTATEFDHGTRSSGSYTPNPSNGPLQKVTNDGAHTLVATAEAGNFVLIVTNGASAGAITFSGFEKALVGDTYALTNTLKFAVFIFSINSVQFYQIKALQ